MAALSSLIPELEEALTNGSSTRRNETLRRITDLFLSQAGRFGEEHVALFDDVLSRLIIEIETKALAELAGRLAPVGNAPVKVIRKLARDDDITVAGPVLLQSDRLDQTDLVDIARTKSQAHLLAISSRTHIGLPVTDVLVVRGDSEVLRSVANNPGARFSETGFAALVKRAAQDGALAEKVGQRPDIPPHLFRSLLLQATEIVQRRLLASARPETQAQIKQILAKVSGEIGAKAPAPRDYEAAQRKVFAMRSAGRLGEPELIEFAKSGQFEETVAALSALLAVPIDIVDRLVSGERADPVLILCKAGGFAWPTARVIIEVAAGDRRISPSTFVSASSNFERLSLPTAKRVLKFWQLQPQPKSDIAAVL
ncbi:MAG TPA: DUF2336 domain-containing protein [Xanthobacteraceae bacterium]|jgi:uncharacterized protein (DUF2336 family)|nr:DUF2336 domain-containing protein [Xanthobacteraceae bacterium]